MTTFSVAYEKLVDAIAERARSDKPRTTHVVVPESVAFDLCKGGTYYFDSTLRYKLRNRGPNALTNEWFLGYRLWVDKKATVVRFENERDLTK